MQRPGPPVWVGGHSEGALRRTARFGDGFMPTSLTAATYARAVSQDRALRGGVRPGPEHHRPRHAPLLQGRRKRGASLGPGLRGHDQPNGRKVEILPHESAVGTVDDCLRSIERFLSCGIEHIAVNPICKRPEYMGQVEIFATQIMPRFK